MSSRQLRDPKFLYYIENIKKELDFNIVDCHVHPFDVMSTAHSVDYAVNKNGQLKMKEKEKKFKKMRYMRSKTLEKVRFGRNATRYSLLMSKIKPKKFVQDLRATYDNIVERKLLEEMDRSFIDYVACLPVEPYSTPDEIKKNYNNKRFLHLGSVDIHGLELEEIEPRIRYQVEKLGIIGLKLHPNIQNFIPEPRENSLAIREKLEKIYKCANKYKLFILFHGGKQSYNWLTKIRYGEYQRSTTNGLLKNFCNKRGKSDVFELIKTPIIIAHLGHFGLKRINKNLVSKIVDKYDHVYFDTSAASPEKIKSMLDTIGSEKILYGSDAIYNRMLSCLYFLYEAVHMSKTKERRDEVMSNILGRNFDDDIYDLDRLK